MTHEENELLSSLLKKKQAECNDAIDVLNEMFDNHEEAKIETRHLREFVGRIMFTRLSLEFGSHAQALLDHMTEDGMINRNQDKEDDAKSKANAEINIDQLYGKKLYSYDSWNGSSCTITIEKIESESQGLRFIGTNSYDGQSGIFVPEHLIKELIETGSARKTNEIDHCNVETRWSLK